MVELQSECFMLPNFYSRLVSLPDEELEMARAHLNSLTQTMLSLFMSISGGLNWVDLAGPLQARGGSVEPGNQTSK